MSGSINYTEMAEKVGAEPPAPHKDWSIQKFWNDDLFAEVRENEKRGYIRASELGGSMLDRYLKMMGVPFTNPYDARTLRVFEMGNQIEGLVVNRLERLGLVINTQEEVRKEESEKSLPIVGHYDVDAGGNNFIGLSALTKSPELRTNDEAEVADMGEVIMEKMAKEYPNGLEPLIYEVKSIQETAFHEYADLPYQHHRMQLGFYLWMKKREQGRLLYVCKSHLCLQEIPVVLTDELKNEIATDAAMISDFIRLEREPSKEPQITVEGGKARRNWKLGYSPYLTRHTGCATRGEWEERMVEPVKEINKLFKAGEVDAGNALITRHNDY